jgi:hypothetical protein
MTYGVDRQIHLELRPVEMIRRRKLNLENLANRLVLEPLYELAWSGK